MYIIRLIYIYVSVYYITSFIIEQYDKLNERYSPLWLVAQRLGLSAVALSKITATFKCEKGSPNK